jgi:hypothetical protein
MSASFDGINFDVSPAGMILLLSFANCYKRGKDKEGYNYFPVQTVSKREKDHEA